MFLVYIVHNISIAISSGNSPKLYLLNRHVLHGDFFFLILFVSNYMYYTE